MRTSHCHKHGETQFTDHNLNGDSFCVQCLREFEQTYKNNPAMMAALEETQSVLKMISAAGIKVDAAAVEALREKTGAELVAAGYMQVSRKYRTIARLPPGKTAIEAMKELHPHAYQQVLEDIEQSAMRQYLRVYAHSDGNTLELTEEQFNAFRDAGGQSA